MWTPGGDEGGVNLSFLDGTESAIEMAAVANATNLIPARGGRRKPSTTPGMISPAARRHQQENRDEAGDDGQAKDA
jgi:predicted homoserine dehydrogenase-like protein